MSDRLCHSIIYTQMTDSIEWDIHNVVSFYIHSTHLLPFPHFPTAPHSNRCFFRTGHIILIRIPRPAFGLSVFSVCVAHNRAAFLFFRRGGGQGFVLVLIGFFRETIFLGSWSSLKSEI